MNEIKDKQLEIYEFCKNISFKNVRFENISLILSYFYAIIIEIE